MAPDSPDPSPRARRWRRFLLIFVVLGVLCQGCFWIQTRPPVPDVDVPAVGQPRVEGTLARLGGSSLERRDGYWFMVHTGSPATMGAEHARLGGFLTQRAETVLRADFDRRLPAPLKLMLPPLLMWRFRHLGDSIPEDLLTELYTFGETYEDRTPFPLNAYQRGIYYHALHDMVQDLVGNPYVDPGVAGACTAFAGSGAGTTNGHTLVGRNFDFEVVPIFDSEKVVHLYATDGKIPVVSVSWMGMSGVLTGMNADGIWLALNAARSEGRNRVGPPVALLVREILESARSLDDVERMLAAQDPIVTDIYVAADGKTGQVAAFERGQTRMGRRDLGADGKLAVANHLLSETFAGDKDDADLRRYSTTLARQLRMDELVAEEPLSVDRGVELLRDRRGPDGLDLAPGNRNAIDAFIATHSVVGDATDRVIWVAGAPHTQGAYRTIDLLAELEKAGIDATPWRATLPAGARAWERPAAVEPEGDDVAEVVPAGNPWAPDRLSHDRSGAPRNVPRGDLASSGELEQVERYFDLLHDAEELIDNEQPHAALVVTERALALFPRSAEAKRHAGDAHLLLGDEDAARSAYIEYLQRYPGIGPEYVQTTRWLEEHGGLPDVERPDLSGGLAENTEASDGPR